MKRLLYSCAVYALIIATSSFGQDSFITNDDGKLLLIENNAGNTTLYVASNQQPESDVINSNNTLYKKLSPKEQKSYLTISKKGAFIGGILTAAVIATLSYYLREHVVIPAIPELTQKVAESLKNVKPGTLVHDPYTMFLETPIGNILEKTSLGTTLSDGEISELQASAQEFLYAIQLQRAENNLSVFKVFSKFLKYTEWASLTALGSLLATGVEKVIYKKPIIATYGDEEISDGKPAVTNANNS